MVIKLAYPIHIIYSVITRQICSYIFLGIKINIIQIH